MINNISYLDNKIEQVLLGSLLGDGCISFSNKKYNYGEEHCKKQEEYLLWKNKMLKFNIHYRKNENSIMIQKSNKEFKEFYDLFYPNKKKIISKEILNRLKPLGVAIWFMDDGYYEYRGRSLGISTQSFGLGGNETIKEWFLEKFNIKCEIRKSKSYTQYLNNRKIISSKAHFLQFNVENTQKLIKIIELYIIKSMQYKIGKSEEKIREAQEKTHQYTSNRSKKDSSIGMRVEKPITNLHALQINFPILEGKIEDSQKHKEFLEDTKIYYYKNKERICKRRREIYSLIKDKKNEKVREKRRENREEYNKYCREYYHKNKEQIKQKRKTYKYKKLFDLGESKG